VLHQVCRAVESVKPHISDRPGLRLALAASALCRRGDTAAARAFAERPLDEDHTRIRGALAGLARAVGIQPSEASDRVARALEAADAMIAGVPGLGVSLLSVTDPRYPAWLRTIVDPPLALWVRGHVDALSCPAVALVGSRDATPVGLSVARRLARGLADAGLMVVSGLARGIDGAAHAGALDAGGTSVAVLGSGIDVTYPSSHAGLATELTRQGAIVSELPPGTPPLPGHFPLRNRIISGLARAVVVVEASERSGSLITARLALEQSRDVLAVPGGIASGRHRGCHALIKDGARLVETVGDILDELGWMLPMARPPVTGPADAAGISTLEAVMAAGEPYALDDLAARTGRPVAELLAELGRLEVAGRITRSGAARFVRLDASAMDRW